MRRKYPVISFAVLLGALAAGLGAIRFLTEKAGPVQNSHTLSSAVKPSASAMPALAAPPAALQRKTSAAPPLAFEPNQGQTDARVQFLSRGPGFTAFLTSDEAVLKLREPATRKPESKGSTGTAGLKAGGRTANHAPHTIESILRMELEGANSPVIAKGTDELPGKTNYFRGPDPQKWHTNLPNYAKVHYENIYPSVDLLYYGNQGRLEYDFEVRPGGDPGVIRLKFPGGQQVHVDNRTGDLLVRAAKSYVRFHQPVVYQTDDRGGKSYLTARYRVNASRQSVSFRVAPYDHRRTLIIDPALSYSTYLGGSQDDEGNAIAVDSSGSVYVAGLTDSIDFPVSSGAFQTACGGGCSGSTYDAFVTKLNPSGSGLVYSTYLGGSQTDQGEGIAINSAGDAYVTGITYSPDFPVTPGAFQTECTGGFDCAGGEAFVTELNSTGSALVYSTYLGGSAYTQGNAVVLNTAGDAYVTGWTSSDDFPVTPGVLQPTCAACASGSASGFVTELNPSGSGLVYSTFLGGSSTQQAYAIALDSSGDAYVVGFTTSPDFPTTAGAFQTSIAAPEAGFVSKLNPTASALIYSTYLGGSGTGSNPCAACAAGIVVDRAGEAYVSGLTWETNFPVTAGALQTTYAGGFHDAFLTKLNAAGSALVFSTYLGGSSDDGAVALALDPSGRVYMRGNTYSDNFPVTPGAFQTAPGGGSDALFAILNSAGSKLIYSTYLGGTGDEFGHATQSLVMDSQNPPNAYLTGFTSSNNFPVTSGGFQTLFGGVYDAFVSKFAPSPNVGLSPSSLTFGDQAVGTSSSPQTMTLTNTGTATLKVTSVSVTGADAADFSQTNNCTAVVVQATCTVSVIFTPTASGTRTAALSIADNAPGSPQTPIVSGTSGGPIVSLSPASLTFPAQIILTASTAQKVTLTNTGLSTLSITSISTTGNFSQRNTCSQSLASGASCKINVVFGPTQVGTQTGTVSVVDNAAGSPQTVALTGVGTVVLLNPTSLDFGSQKVHTTSKGQNIQMTNKGSSTISISSIAITGSDPTDFAENNNCKTSLAAGASCTITVKFVPTVAQQLTATVSITDAGGGSPQTVALSGTGT
ncbi:MAG TPA: choice-of-anchor D domain-containing protein [Terriglobia bacterium]|nr:choice-of-anchor D domain-containing protein [Terriglobia bacterium]